MVQRTSSQIKTALMAGLFSLVFLNTGCKLLENFVDGADKRKSPSLAATPTPTPTPTPFEITGTTSFSNVAVLEESSITATITNKQNSDLPYSITPPNSDFTIGSSGCGSSGQLAAGASCSLQIKWFPTRLFFDKQAQFQVVSGSMSVNFNVGLSTKDCFYHTPNAKVDKTDANAGNKRQIWITCTDMAVHRPVTTQTTTNIIYHFPTKDGRYIYFMSDGALDGSDSATGVQNIWKLDVKTGTRTPITNFTIGYMRGMALDEDDGLLFYASTRKTDGTNAVYTPLAGAAQAVNLWKIKTDGTANTPITSYTNANTATSVLSFAVDPSRNKLVLGANYKLDGTDNREGTMGWGNGNVWIMNYDGTQKYAVTKYSALSPTVYAYFRFTSDNTLYYGINAKLDGTDAAGQINWWKATGYPGPNFVLTPVTDYSGPATGYELPIANDYSTIEALSSNDVYMFSNRKLDGTQALQGGGGTYFNIFRMSLSNPATLVPITNYSNVNAFSAIYSGYFSDDGRYYYGAHRAHHNGTDTLHTVNNLFKFDLQTGSATAITQNNVADIGIGIKRLPKEP